MSIITQGIKADFMLMLGIFLTSDSYERHILSMDFWMKKIGWYTHLNGVVNDDLMITIPCS